MTRRQQAARLRALLTCMQAVITTKRLVWRSCPPIVARLLTMRLWLIGVWIVAEMQRLEGNEAA